MTEANPESITLTIEGCEDGERVDKIAAKRLDGVSRSTIKRWILDGRVELDGVAVMPKTRVREGAELEITPAPPEVPDLVPQDIPIEVLVEDEHLALVNKPAGLVVHPAPGHPDGTLVNALLYYFGRDEALAEEPKRQAEAQTKRGISTRSFVAGAIRPGIVHRLDKDTSGVMVVAKTPQTHEGLVDLFSRHDIERAYTAIVWGKFEGKQTFDTFHGRHPGDRKKFTSKTDRGRRAVTHVEAVAQLGPATQVRCTLETGRTHQIRVHLSEHGYPLVGDPVYGRAPKDAHLRELATQLSRQALHAQLLAFVHPITRENVRAESPLPKDIEVLLEHLSA